MPKNEYKPFFKKAVEVIRQTGNPLNVHTSRMAERASSLINDLKNSAEGRVLSPTEFERIGEKAGEFRVSEKAMENFQKTGGGKAEALMTAKYTRKGILGSGSQAGTVAPGVLKNIGARPGSSFSELASKASAAFKKVQPDLKTLLNDSAEAIKTAAKAGDKDAIAVLRGRVFKFVSSGLLPSLVGGALLPDIGEIVAEERRGEMKKQGA